jgi:AraC-like DNA-binding protein
MQPDGTLARSVTWGGAAWRLAQLKRKAMQGEELHNSSVVLTALAGAWHCEDAQVLSLPAGGVTTVHGEAGGLRIYWVDQALCSVQWGHECNRETLVPPSSLVMLPRGMAHRLAPVAEGMAWALSAVWPTSAWCASLLIHDEPLVATIAPAHQPDALRALRAGTRPVQPAATAGPLAGACARALLEHGLRVAEATPAQSMLAGALAHARLGVWLREALVQTGPLPSIDDSAARCNLSRAAFTRHFAGLTDLSCAEFLTRWRMNAALHRMVVDQMDVGDAAALYGYESEASFRKAFRRATGLTPGAARRAGSMDAAFGNPPAPGLQQGPAVAGTSTRAPLAGAAPRVAVTTHTAPPDLASMLSAVISGL